MGGRFETLYKLNDNLYKNGASIIVSGGVLLKDRETDNIVAQFKFQSISEYKIKALKISIKAYDVSDKILEGIEEYQYLDLNINNGEYFGSNKAIVMPDNVTRSIEIGKILVVFEGRDNSEICGAELLPLETPQSLESVLDGPGLIEQYQIETSTQGKYIPTAIQDLWLCTCGKVNNTNNCTSCRVSKEKVFNAYNPVLLQEHLKVRLDAEEAERERQERIAEISLQEAEQQKRKRRKQIMRITRVTVVVVILLSIIAFAWTKIINPSIQYSKAESYYEKGDYDNAIVIYKELGEYKDSVQKLASAIDLKDKDEAYSSALSLFNDGQYLDALRLFEKVYEYPDVTYYRGKCYFEIESYKKAIELYEEVGNDSDFKNDAEKEILEGYYYLGLEALRNGEFSVAKEFLDKTEYGNSKEALLIIEKIKQENWIGIYRNEEDDSEWMQIVCSVNDDLTYTYEVYRQSSIWEDYSTNLVVEADGTMILVDEFNDYNEENNGGHWIEESTHQFQEDKSVYEDTGGSKGYGGGYSTIRIDLKQQGDDLVMHTKALTSSFEYGAEEEEEESEYSTAYIRQ